MSADDLLPAGFIGPAPSPVFFDLAAWPIAFVRFPELDDEDRLEGVLGGLEMLLDQKVPLLPSGSRQAMTMMTSRMKMKSHPTNGSSGTERR